MSDIARQADMGPLFPDFPQVVVEYHGQVVSPCAVLRTMGPFLRIALPVKNQLYRVRWILSWRVIARETYPEPLMEFEDGRRVVCWICKKRIKPDKAPRALCVVCATGGGLGPYT